MSISGVITMCGRVVVRSKVELQRLSSGKKVFISSLMGPKMRINPENIVLKPQATTNPGTKGLPRLYFFRYSDPIRGLELHRKDYPSDLFLLIFDDHPVIKIKQNTGSVAEYIFEGFELKPDSKQYLVEASMLDEPEPERQNTAPSKQTGQQSSFLEYCTIM